MHGLYAMITVTRRKLAEALIPYYRAHGVTMTLCSLGEGTANSEMLHYWGLADTERAILFSVLPDDCEKALLRGLKRDMQLDVPGNGIAFTVPLTSVGGANTLRYLSGGKSLEGCEEIVQTENKYEVIFAIANRDHAESVMDAARAAGAGGGTVIHAKGTGSQQAERFFGVSIAAEKDMVLIVAKAAEKAAIMRAIMDEAGMRSGAQAFVFSLPVSDVAGMRNFDEDV